jgi:hypothetical protein
MTDVGRGWNSARIESLACEVERCGRAIRELGPRCEASAARAMNLGRDLRAASHALAFVNDDHDGIALVIDRLEQLAREAEGLLTVWQDDVTHEYSETLRARAHVLFDDDVTRVRPRIVPPRRVGAGLRRA